MNVINARWHINIQDSAINCRLLLFHITYMYLVTDICTEWTPLTRIHSTPQSYYPTGYGPHAPASILSDPLLYYLLTMAN